MGVLHDFLNRPSASFRSQCSSVPIKESPMWPRPSLDSFRKGYTFAATPLSIEALRDKITNVQLQPQRVLPHFGLARSERPPALAACMDITFLNLFLPHFISISLGHFTLNGAERSFAFLHLSIDPASLLTRLNKRSYAQEFTWQWLPCMGEANSCNRT